MKYSDIRVGVVVNGSTLQLNSAQIKEHMATLQLAQERIDDEASRIDATRRLANAESTSHFAIEMRALTHGVMGNKIKAIKLLRCIEDTDGNRLSLIDAKNIVETLINTYEGMR